MSGSDYTRWNRAGRRRVDYVDGNAAHFLDAIRLALVDRFEQGSWSALRDNETVEAGQRGMVLARQAPERLAKLRARYEAEPGDIGWELARSFARACHVLAGHIDAYANEHFIETATQWESLRRLVAMLDYAPNPPASASTPIVLLAKTSGRIEVGALQVSHSPPRGDAVVFENLEDLDLDPALNTIRLAGWNRSTRFADVREMIWEPPEDAEPTIGGLLLVEQLVTGQGFASTIDWIEHGRLTPAAAPRELWPLADTRLLFNPKGARKPHMQGARVICVAPGHGFNLGDVIGWRVGTGWKLAVVQASEADRLQLSTNELPGAGTELFSCKPIGDGKQARLPLDVQAIGWFEGGYPKAQNPDQVLTVIQPEYAQQVQATPPPDAYKQLEDSYANKTIYLIAGVDRPTTSVVVPPPSGWLVFDGAPTGWQTGAWFVGERDDGELEALRLIELATLERGFRARFDRKSQAPLVKVHGPFKQTLRPRGWDFDDGIVEGERLVLERPSGPGLLGRRVLLRGSGRSNHIATIVRRAGAVVIVDPPVPSELGLRAGEVEVHGNVVLFGHGERKPAQILGSGDATRSNQRFLLAVEAISFVADPGRASGVRADIQLLVDGRRWQQVDALRDSGPTDEHYVVRMTEAGELTLETGDGVNGRRLPSGANNLRVELRVGTGLAGNVPAGSFKRLGKPHRLVDSLMQPRPATGGNDMAAADELRELAPGTVLALGRAVALEDFALLASAHASVWQARARRLPVTGASERVEVTIVPAGGGALGAEAETLRAYLLARTLPDVEIVIRGYRERGFALLVRVAVDEDRYQPEQVLASIRAALEHSFALRRRRLGQSVELAEIVEIVETTTGVLHSGVIIDGDPQITSLAAEADEVLVLTDLELLATADTTRTTGGEKQLRAIERRLVTIIQGVGTGTTEQPAAYQKALAAEPLRITELHELAALDPVQAVATLPQLGNGRQFPPSLLREFVIKARLVLELRVSEPLIARLGNRTLGELLDLDVDLLADHHQVERQTLFDLRDRLRTIQLCLDEPAIDSIRLAEFSTVPELAELLPEPAGPGKSRPVALLPATIIAGVGLATAQRLAKPPTNCRTVADVAYMNPERVAARDSQLRPANMWEIKRKAQILLALELPSTLTAETRDKPLQQLLALDDAALQSLAGAEIEAMRRLLLELELALEAPPIPMLPGSHVVGLDLANLTLASLFG